MTAREKAEMWRQKPEKCGNPCAGSAFAPAAESCAHLSDSILAHPVFGKLSNTWLGLIGHVDCGNGRSFLRHDWHMDKTVDTIYVHVAGNDFIKKGTVKGSLPHGLDDKVGEVLGGLRQKTRRLYFVVWGDWSTWRRGFKPNQTAEDGERYDKFCEELLRMATPYCTGTIHITGKTINHLQLISDNMHFALDAREGVRKLLQQMGAAVEVDEEVNYAGSRSGVVTVFKFTASADRARRQGGRCCHRHRTSRNKQEGNPFDATGLDAYQATGECPRWRHQAAKPPQSLQ